MKPFAKLGYLAATCALLVTTFALIGPRAVQAAVTALIRDQDNAARHSWFLTCGAPALSCTMTVPLGVEYVIQTADIFGNISGTPNTADFVVVTQTAGQTMYQDNLIAPAATGPGTTDYVATSSHIMYADPGTQITCQLTSMDGAATTKTLTCDLTGYYVTLP
jgi:hypothetical protein